MCNYLTTNKEIEKAEEDIFENGDKFNNEQRNFLKCLDSCHVQAFAGTGKTSSIVGKLHILAQKKVWKNGRGICVISHTNVAVDEIKKHVAKHYPSILEYPNFVGTIQEFINKFLFIPYLGTKGQQIKSQDEDRYFDTNDLEAGLKDRLHNHIKSKVSHSENKEAKKIFYEKLNSVYLDNENLYTVDFHNKKLEFKDLEIKNFSQNLVIQGFKKIIEKLHSEGRFLYIESFLYGLDYLNNNTILKKIISQRFQFVFLDEAQDCSQIQLLILNELFDNSATVFQQIGDENQEISETVWKPINPIYLGRSERFKVNLANFVNLFKIGDGPGVIGTQAKNLSDHVKLYLIIYKGEKEKDVLKKYTEILNIEKIPLDKNFYAISHKHEQLLKYFPDYSIKIAKSQNKKTSFRFDEDVDYINLITKMSINKYGSNFVFKILLSLLFKHFKVNGNSWNEFREYLKVNSKIESFKKLTLGICTEVLKRDKISDLNNLKNKLNIILGDGKIIFHKNMEQIKITYINIIDNKFLLSGLEIKVGTIHSVKGQTHNATLIFLNKEYDKYDISHALLNNNKDRTLFYKRLLYVGFSRSKYLMALAIEKNAYLALPNKDIFSNFNKVYYEN